MLGVLQDESVHFADADDLRMGVQQKAVSVAPEYEPVSMPTNTGWVCAGTIILQIFLFDIAEGFQRARISASSSCDMTGSWNPSGFLVGPDSHGSSRRTGSTRNR